MSMDELGPRLRAIRKQRGLVLVDVAQRTGLTIGFLSQVERNIAAPSLSSLALIAAALQTPIDTLMSLPKAPQGISRNGTRESFSPSANASPVAHAPIYERLSADFPDHALNITKARFPPGHRMETSRHAGEEFVYVLSGTVTYWIDDERFALAPGDCLHFRASRPHWVENLGEVWCEVLSVGTLELFDPVAEHAPAQVSRSPAIENVPPGLAGRGRKPTRAKHHRSGSPGKPVIAEKETST